MLSDYYLNCIYNKILDQDWFSTCICRLIGARSRKCPITGIRFELFVIGYLYLGTHVFRTSITRALMVSFALFPTVFKAFEKRYRRLRLNEVFKKRF